MAICVMGYGNSHGNVSTRGRRVLKGLCVTYRESVVENFYARTGCAKVLYALILTLLVKESWQIAVGDVQMRLANGATTKEGRVEVRRWNNETWGTVCDDIWTVLEASVVCRQLQLGVVGEPKTWAAYGQGTGPIHLDDVSCRGNETNLGQCQSNDWGTHNCDHSEDAGVICYLHAVRMVAVSGGFNVAPYGSVILLREYAWVAVCDIGWDDNDARVACRMLGYQDGVAQCCSRLSPYTYSNSRPSARNMNCTGNEESLANCSYTYSTSYCPVGQLASAVCYSVPKTSVDMSISLRLVNGSSNWGRVEVRYLGVWGAVCGGTSWNDSAANVVCKQMGFSGGGVALGKPRSDVFIGSPWVTRLNCSGNETSLEQCVVSPWGSPVSYCSPSYALCYSTESPTVRIIGGPNFGRVEITMDEVTYTVCDNGWDAFDANVVCKSLGYFGGQGLVGSYYGAGAGSVALDTVGCTSSEKNLLSCTSAGWLVADSKCSAHANDASVYCYSAVRLFGGDHSTGILMVYTSRQAHSPVCGTGFDNQDAIVACRSLGFENGTALPPGSYGSYISSYVWTNLTCAGNESSLYNCTFSTTMCPGTGYTNYAAVACFNGSASTVLDQSLYLEGSDGDFKNISVLDQSVSLEGSDGDFKNSTGRIIIRKGGVRGRVCPSFWDDKDALVVCRQLGYSRGAALAISTIGSGPFLLNDVACAGTEDSIFDCIQNSRGCSSSAFSPDAGVVCYQNVAQLTFQLVGGASSKEGRVEVVLGGQRGSVCTFGGYFSAKVICKQLGYVDGVVKSFPGVAGSVALDGVNCYGYESSLLMCRNSGFFPTAISACRSYSTVLGVSCFEEVRLYSKIQEDNTTVVGVVQLYRDAGWKYVCGDFFDNVEAGIVCRQLGYGYSRALPRGTLGSQFIYFTNANSVGGLNCTGVEITLGSCPLRVGSCSNTLYPYTNYASVLCSRVPIPQGQQAVLPLTQPGYAIVRVDGLDSLICSDQWDDKDAGVYCRELGFNFGKAMGYVSYSTPSNPRLLSNFNCSGSETTIESCPHFVNLTATCSATYLVARVFCFRNTNDMQIRLTGSQLRHEGRIDIGINGVWGSVCDYTWTVEDAAVLCRTLGFSGGRPAPRGSYSTSNGPSYLYYVSCTGSEETFWLCPAYAFNVTYPFCNSYNAGVLCAGEVKLEPNTTFGALEVLVNATSSQYGLVCSDNFTDTEASVACRDLGFEYGIHMCCSAFGNMRTPPIMRTGVTCTGREAMLKDCSSSAIMTYCPSRKYASVVCSNIAPGNGYAVRIETVEDLPYGRVQVHHMGYWGYVCTDGFDDKDAKVICKEAGYAGGRAFEYNDYRGGIFDTIRWLSNINCAGTESYLTRCDNVIWGNVTSCSVYADAGVFCYEQSAPEFRLVNGTKSMGRLELWADGVGGTVCGRYWSDRHATTACRDLGFKSGRFLGAGTFGQGPGNVLIDYSYCSGFEDSLLNCYIWLYGIHDYEICSSHAYDAAIQCFDKVRFTGRSTQANYGRVEVYVNSTWTAVCDQGFDSNAAQVACRALGYTYARPQCCSALGPLMSSFPSATSIGVKVNRCSGSEVTLTDCDVTYSTCSSGKYASVLCSNSTIQETPLQVRLKGAVYGSGGYYGNVEVNRYGFWGPVCNNSWDDKDANATCHGLGYAYGITFYAQDNAGNPLVVGDFQCTGLEASLANCSFKDIDDDIGCPESRARIVAGVLCYNSGNVSLRLVSGGPNYGRLEVQYEGVWGRVADFSFSDQDANVACRQLGFFGGRSAPISIRTSSTGKIWMYNVICKGYERTIFECFSYWNYRRSYSRDANVICYGKVRLMRGNGVSMGIVDVNIHNVWGPVCDHQWTSSDTAVTCRQLGYEGGYHLCCGVFGYNLYPVMNNVQCTGSETELSACPHDVPDSSPFCTRENVAVACYKGSTPTDYTYSLSGGPTNNTGEVLVRFMNSTGRVCSDTWNDTDAKVFCRELGFQFGKAYEHFLFNNYYYYSSTGPFWMTDVNCQGTESSLRDCPKALGGVSQCNSGKAAGVLCTDTEGIYYRLGGTDSSYKGRVEISVNGVWGTVCGYYFDSREASVFCRTLGFNEGMRDYYTGQYPNPPSKIYQANFQCTGSETFLDSCPHQGWQTSTSSYCSHNNDANVVCYNDVRIGGAYDPNIKQGPVQFYQNGTWFALCDTGFDDNAARRVCQDLEFLDGKAVCCSAYGSYSYYVRQFEVHLNYTMECKGTESTSTQCIKASNCDSGNYASVVCFNRTDFEDESYSFDLVGGTMASGQVSVTHFGVPGRVCNTYWDDVDARVLCRARGYPDGLAFHYSQSNYQTFSSRGPFWVSGMNCTGNETSLNNCSFTDRFNLGNCSAAELAGAFCFNQSGIQYRLANGPDQGKGRVEISVAGVWGTVCDTFWDNRDASVLCRSLNYSDGYAVANAFYGRGTGPIWLSQLQCQGTEATLDKCPHSGFNDEVVVDSYYYGYGCQTHYNDASVVCVDRLKLNLGLNASMGAVMVYRKNSWTLICDSGLDSTDALVVCRSLGFSNGAYVKGGVFGRVEAQIGITNVRCTGRESSFLSCPYDVSTSCTSGKYASVFCSKDPILESEQPLRIIQDDITDPRHGFLDVQVEGVWGGVCLAGFDSKTASVACKQLGYAGGVAYAPNRYNHTLPILTSGLKCQGIESKLDRCPRISVSSTYWCDFYAPRAGVLCYNDTEGISYRLNGDSSSSSRGRLEMKYGGQWGMLCSFFYNIMEARVACRNIGFKDGLSISGSRYSAGTEALPFWFYFFHCQGNESSITECSSNGFNSSAPYISYYTSLCRTSYGPLSVQCYTESLAITNVRLVNGNTASSGRVEVYLKGPNQWGTVCDDYWNDIDATVICNQLGYATGKAIMEAAFGQGTGSIWLDNVGCKGTETRLQDCSHSGFGVHNCHHSEDAGVMCSGVYVPPTTTTTTVKTTQTTSKRLSTKTQSTRRTTTIRDKIEKQTGANNSSSTAAIASPIVIIIIIISIVAFVLYRRHQKHSNNPQRMPTGEATTSSKLNFGTEGAVRFINKVRSKVRKEEPSAGDYDDIVMNDPSYDSGIMNPNYDSATIISPESHADHSSSNA